jgi:hypothetical protein
MSQKIKILSFVFFLQCFASLGQTSLFDEESILEFEVIGNLKSLFNDVNPNKAKYHKIFLFYIDGDSSITVNAKAKTRGLFRRSKQNCRIPPLALKVNEFENSIFPENIKIKLVNPCFIKNRYVQYVIKEYYAYKIYNILTEYSFRVRLCRIIYIDRGGNHSNFETYGILIEPVKLFAKRTRTKEIETQGIIQNATYRPVLDRMTMFQYLIGNTDWSVPKLHNIKLFYSDSLASLIPVPYDFDFCGFVNPPYTKPPEIIPIKHVTDRYYRGNCRERIELDLTINFFLEKEDQIFKMLKNDTLLTERNKKSMIDYISMFYETLKDEKLLTKEIVKNCRDE